METIGIAMRESEALYGNMKNNCLRRGFQTNLKGACAKVPRQHYFLMLHGNNWDFPDEIGGPLWKYEKQVFGVAYYT